MGGIEGGGNEVLPHPLPNPLPSRERAEFGSRQRLEPYKSFYFRNSPHPILLRTMQELQPPKPKAFFNTCS